MDEVPNPIDRYSPFRERYERRRQRWFDGPHESWESFDRVIERDVVLNIARSHLRTGGFLQSAKAASSLQHPNILPVYDLGIAGDHTPFYTTPPIRGKTLHHLLPDSRYCDPSSRPESSPILPLAWALRDSCRALEYAHQRGILHLDLHPDRLLIGEDYHVILDVDGWAKAGPRDGGEGCVGHDVGRPAYMSPEHINEAGPGVGPATDVFGLGGILYFILFGTPPNHLEGPSNPLKVIKAITGRAFEPRRPGTIRPGITSVAARGTIDGLVAICLKALSYEPEARYQSAAKMGEAIEECEARSRSSRTRWSWWR